MYHTCDHSKFDKARQQIVIGVKQMEVDTRDAGWLAFASVMMIVAGSLIIIWGFTALIKPELLSDRTLFGSLTLRGIILLIIGPVEVVAGFAVLLKTQWARWFGIVVASLGTIWTFTDIWSYPVGSVILIALQVMVIYGLVVHGGRILRFERIS